MKRVLAPRPDVQPAPLDVARNQSPPTPGGSLASPLPPATGSAASPATDGNGVARGDETLPPIECEEYFRSGVKLIAFEVKDPEGPLFSVTWTPPDNRGVDVDKLKGGILAHIPGAKFKDFFVGRGRGGLGNLKEASAPYVMLSRGRDGCIAKFTSPEITDGRVATWYDNPPEKQFAAALAAAKVQLRENDQAALDRLLKGEQKELALFGYPLRIRYGETANGSLIVESIATEGRSE